MLVDPIPMYPRRRRVKAKASAVAGPAALTLVGVIYDSGGTVGLRFDRAIAVGGLVGGQITVSDGGGEVDATRAATGTVILLDANTVQIGLNLIGPPSGGGPSLTAGAGNGIVATNDGAAWAGATGVAIPFGTTTSVSGRGRKSMSRR